MPIVAHSQLPAFAVLSREGIDVVPVGAASAALPSLRIGLLNLMPDAAVQATERQFLRLVDAYGAESDLYVYPFALPSDARGEVAQAHVDAHYSDFESLRDEGLQALIITGANPAASDITAEPFWEPLMAVIDWARTSVGSIICSCLATHAVLHRDHGIEREELPQRRWGVYEHQIMDRTHPLMAGLSAPVIAPHSHRYDISRSAMEAAGIRVLVASKAAGVHLAVSDDRFRFLFFQGHPEYDAISLLKEFKREVQRFLSGERADYPQYPENYLSHEAKEQLDAYQRQATGTDSAMLPDFPESELAGSCVNAWREAGRRIYRNWLAELS
jgi:homoserine O-succinyltransferase